MFKQIPLRACTVEQIRKRHASGCLPQDPVLTGKTPVSALSQVWAAPDGAEHRGLRGRKMLRSGFVLAGHRRWDIGLASIINWK